MPFIAPGSVMTRQNRMTRRNTGIVTVTYATLPLPLMPLHKHRKLPIHATTSATTSQGWSWNDSGEPMWSDFRRTSRYL